MGLISAITVPIYNVDVAFLVEVEPQEFERFYYDNVTRITDEEYKGIKADILDKKGTGGVVWTLDSGLFLVYLRDGRSDIFVPHEIFHVCNRILCRAGVIHDASAEPWAYLIGWMTNEYYKMYWDWADKVKV
jgi:hypothetical protein